MKRLLILLTLFVCLPAIGQRYVDEVDSIATLKARNVHNLNQSVFVRSADGGLFVITNSNASVDEIFRIASTFNPSWSYDRKFSGPIDFRWNGAVGDGTPGDNTKIAEVLAAAASRGYAVLVPNLTGSNNTNQFELSLIPSALKANQKYLQVGASGGLQIYTDNLTNFIYAINGVAYKFPALQGATNTVMVNDGTGALTWQALPSGGGGGGTNTYVFGDQFQTNGVNVALADGLATTNQTFRGRLFAPTIDVPGINIDASTGTEFSKILASNTTMGIVNMTNDETIHVTITNSTFTLGFTNTLFSWLSGVTPTIDTNAVNVYHFTKKGGWIYASDPEQKANANLVAVANIAGTGVVTKTNSTTFVTFNPLPVRFGGTGTNTFSSFADGNLIFYDKTNDRLDSDDQQLLYSKSLHSLFLARTTPTGFAQLSIFESSGTVPLLELYANMIKQNNDNFTLNGGSNILFSTGGGTSLKVSIDRSVIAGGGSTNTTRTNQFLYLPISGGPPTGAPVDESGHLPMVFDVINTNLYFYVNGGWTIISGTGGSTVFSGFTNGVVFSPDASSITNGTNFVVLQGGQEFQMYSAGFIYPIQLFDTTTGSELYLKGDDILFGTARTTNPPTMTVQRSTVQLPLWIRFESENPLITLATNRSVVLGMSASTNVARTTNFVYLETTRGVPTGAPAANGNSVALTYDTVNSALMAYNGGSWQNVGGGGTVATNISPANPTASVGLTVVNGSSTNYMRADAAPPLSQTISPEWSGQHIFDRGIVVGTNTPANLGVLYPSNMTNGLVFAAFNDISKGDPLQASISYAVANNLSLGTPEQSSFASLVSSTNAELLLTATRTNGTSSQIILNAATNGTSLLMKNGTSTNLFVSTSTGYSGAGTNFLSDDGTFKAVIGGSGSSTNGANWFAQGATNSQLNGNAFVNRITATNGFAVGSALYTSVSAGMANNGGAVSVQQLSSTAGSSMTLDSGNAVTSWLLMRAGNTNRMLVGSNGIVQMFFGGSADNMTVTNALNIGVGTSGTTARAGGTLFVYKTPTGNIGAGQDDLMTYAVVANQLATDKDRLEIRCSGQWAGNANNKQVRAFFGTQQLFATGTQAYNGGDWVLTIEIIRENSSGEICNVTWLSGNSLLTSSATVSFPAEDLTTTVVFKLTGEGSNNNDILQRSESVIFYPTP